MSLITFPCPCPLLPLLLLSLSFVWIDVGIQVDAQSAPPLLSIIFITKRPGPPSLPLCQFSVACNQHAGGYDILLTSLSQQSSKDYELICKASPPTLLHPHSQHNAPGIDELAPWRRDEVESAAAALNVPLAHMTRSKPRARESRFGIANAINSGFLLARGRYMTVLQVYICFCCHIPSHRRFRLASFVL